MWGWERGRTTCEFLWFFFFQKSRVGGRGEGEKRIILGRRRVYALSPPPFLTALLGVRGLSEGCFLSSPLHANADPTCVLNSHGAGCHDTKHDGCVWWCEGDADASSGGF